MQKEKIVFQNDIERKEEYIALIKESFKLQRHDFMNYFQIIYAYIQLGKTNEAINSIKKVTKLNINLSNVYKLSLFHISLYLDKKIRELNDLEYETVIEVNNCTNFDLRCISNEEKILRDLKYIFDSLISRDYSYGTKLELEIEEFEDSIRFLFVGENKTSFITEKCREINYSINERGTTFTFDIIS